MHRMSAAASRRVALAVATTGVVAVLAWTASTARPDSTTSAGVGTTAVALADAETTGFTGGTFGYTVCDSGTTAGAPDPLCADSGIVTIGLGATNQPPVGDDQTVTVAEDATLPIVLTGSDPEGAPITFAIRRPSVSTLNGLMT